MSNLCGMQCIRMQNAVTVICVSGRVIVFKTLPSWAMSLTLQGKASAALVCRGAVAVTLSISGSRMGPFNGRFCFSKLENGRCCHLWFLCWFLP